MPTWTAEIAVDEALARTLVAPFGFEHVRLLSRGWDRTAWLVEEQWVFGFPRRAVVVPGLERELAWLPRVAPQLPTPIPNPEFVGEPSDAFPWPFFGSAYIAGEEAALTELDDEQRTAAGVELACFLRVLHAIDGTGLPLDGNNRADMGYRVPYTRDLFVQLGREVPRALDEAESLPSPPEPSTIAHGDLHDRQVLVHEGRLSGVIDWVDICRGDPSIDLIMLWSFVPASGREAFLDAYGGADDAMLLRSRVLALMMGAVLALYARDQAQTQLESASLAMIERSLSD
ncbi:MAG TPA: phosphotransferase [Gaiellaceae bacterium]|nr:phosphotransferase [Gaiellaceae bacterium]